MYLITSLKTLMNHPGATLLPSGMTSNSKSLVGDQKAVSDMVS